MNNSEPLTLTLVLPMYNPSGNWAQQVIANFNSLKKLLQNLKIQLILVNDGSSSGIIENDLEIVKKNIPDLAYIHYPQNKGKGFAVRAGVHASSSQYVIYTDIDFPYQLENIADVYRKLSEGADVVYGIRNKTYYKNLGMLRKLSSKASLVLNKLFLNIPYSDTQSGIKGFNEEGKKHFLKTRINRYLFDTEFLNYATHEGCNMQVVEIELRPGIVFTKMGIKTMLTEFLNFGSICFNSIGRRKKNNSGKICLSFDLEEFDMPLEYGQEISEPEQMKVSTEGLMPLLHLLEKHGIPSTFFVTANYAQNHRELIKQISAKHEIASHGFYHSRFETADLQKSKEILEQISCKPVVGYRMARLTSSDNQAVKEAGYSYNSSINPTWIPGRYNHLKYPRTAFKENGLVVFPVSVSPYLRIPLFWLSFKNFNFGYYKYLSKKTLKHDGYLSLYFHPHEFADLSKYKIPGYTKKIHGIALLERLDEYIIFLKQYGKFMCIKDLIEGKQRGKTDLPN